MKTLVFGDIHGREIWEKIVRLENFDKVVFLGDYVSTHEDIDDETQIRNLERILQYKENNPYKVILLRGNHDNEALGYGWAVCYPQTSNRIKEWMKENGSRFLKDTQWLYVDGEWIFSHAGISVEWLEMVWKMKVEDVEKLNLEEPSRNFGFCNYTDRFDDYGTDKTQSLTWIRPQTLLNHAIPGKHVVGHTRCGVDETGGVRTVNDRFYFCDALPAEYLVITDGVAEVKRTKDLKSDNSSVSIIAAVSGNSAIGRKGEIPWHISEDLKYFKKTTMGHPIIMGRKTFESMGSKPLQGRRNIVVSRSLAEKNVDGVEYFNSLERALGAAKKDNMEVFVIGGAEIYRQAIKYAERLYITFVDTIIDDADAFFPSIENNEWIGRDLSDVMEDTKTGMKYIFGLYTRKDV